MRNVLQTPMLENVNTVTLSYRIKVASTFVTNASHPKVAFRICISSVVILLVAAWLLILIKAVTHTEGATI